MPQTILVVEDNPITRKVVELALVSEGYEVVTADTARAALSALDHCTPALVLQDIALGGDSQIDGFELVRRLRRRMTTHTPILAFTGCDDEKRLRASGFNAVLLKPIEPSRLVQEVHLHLHDRETVAIPRTTTDMVRGRARAWEAVSSLLAELGNAETTAVVPRMLAAFLHGSGISTGIAFTIENGELVVRAQLGFDPRNVETVADRWRRHPRTHAALASKSPTLLHTGEVEGDLFAGAEVSSLLVIPLADARGCAGMLVVASSNRELQREWLDVGVAISAPVANAIRLALTMERVAASEHKFRGIAEATVDAIVVTDARGTVRYVNDGACALTGLASERLLQHAITSVFPHVATGSHQGRILRADQFVPIETTARSFEDPPGELSWVYIARDLSERTRIADLVDCANRDPLTGLFNRRRLEEDLQSRLAAATRYGITGALLLIDLDRFKPINDRYGHAAGDVTLCTVARILQDNIRESDLAARLGGDEFVVLLDHTSVLGALQCATKLIEMLRCASLPFDLTLGIHASIGISEFPRDGTTASQVFAAADAALYRAKHDGRGCVRTSGEQP